MGLLDEVWFDEELPVLPSRCRRFQTKSLGRDLNRYSVSKDGRLWLVGRVLSAGRPEVWSRDINFDGDIRLIGDEEGEIKEYMARFRHGTLEWVRPLAEAREPGSLE